MNDNFDSKQSAILGKLNRTMSFLNIEMLRDKLITT